jgi:hypothetical protein
LTFASGSFFGCGILDVSPVEETRLFIKMLKEKFNRHVL